MAKENKSARNKVAGGVNWWDFLTSIRPKGFRNTPQYIDVEDVNSRKQLVKISARMVKKRKRNEQKLLNIAKFKEQNNKITINKLHKLMVKPTRKAKQDMIKYGFNIVEWWELQHEI